MRVFVYFNLHKRRWSLKAMDGPSKGRVVAHADKVLLRDCVFRVSEAGRQRVLQTKRKAVHAGVVGDLEAFTGVPTPAAGWQPSRPWMLEDARLARYAVEHGEQVFYDPYKVASFVNLEAWTLGEVVPEWRATMVYLSIWGGRNVFTFDPCDMEEWS